MYCFYHACVPGPGMPTTTVAWLHMAGLLVLSPPIRVSRPRCLESLSPSDWLPAPQPTLHKRRSLWCLLPHVGDAMRLLFMQCHRPSSSISVSFPLFPNPAFGLHDCANLEFWRSRLPYPIGSVSIPCHPLQLVLHTEKQVRLCQGQLSFIHGTGPWGFYLRNGAMARAKKASSDDACLPI